MLDLIQAWFPGVDVAFWWGYLTNGRHLQFYAAFRFTIFAALLGGATALLFGLLGAGLLRSQSRIARGIGIAYLGIVRGVPEVLFFIFFPLAFEQGLEWLISLRVCDVGELGSNPGLWPPCADAQLFFGTEQYLVLGGISLGIVYGAFAANVIHGAMDAVHPGQVEAARAFGMTELQVMWTIRVRQMWVYALPGLSNVWLLLIKGTSLLSLLQVIDIVTWADRIGAPNFVRSAGMIHPDWRFWYYLVLFVFYLLMTYGSEKAFAAATRWAGRGMNLAGDA